MEMKEIAIAFIKAKKSFAPALKSSTNPHFKSRYADLAACLEAVDDSFLANGIVMYQETFLDDSGVTVETVLLHESGESLRGGKLHVPAAKQDPQGYGSALSYARRYSLMAACGIAPEDDDGNAATTAVKSNFDGNGKVKPGNVTPSIAVQEWDKLDEEAKQFLTDIAVDIIAAIDATDIETAHGLFYKNNLDHDEQVALWSRLDSKKRSTIKAFQDKLMNGTLPQ
jgi:hypothetical protein